MNVGFLIGCSEYSDPIPSLRFGASDAVSFAETLHRTCGVDEDSLVVLSDDARTDGGRPRFTNVLRQLSLGRQRLRSARVDTLFFFFSGHGYHSLLDGNQYLLLADSVAEDLERTALPLQVLVSRLQEWDPRHLVLFVDACREPVSEHRALEAETAPTLDVNALLPAGNITFSSCSQGQRSYEHPQVKGGFFTVALREALSDRGRCRTLHELNAYVQQRVPELCSAFGKPSQQPTARLEPAEVLGLDIVSAARRNEWRTHVRIGSEVRFAAPRRRVGELPDQLAVGVDFGTCNTLVGLLGPTGKVEILPTASGRSMLPSVVNFDRDLGYVVGWEALDADRTRPEGTVLYPKRDLGTPRQYAVHDRSLTPELVSSLILRSLRRTAEEHLGRDVPSVVASFPAAFGIAQRNALREAFDLAGWHVDRFVSEPAVSGYLRRTSFDVDDADELILVVDLGGGTLDVSLIESGSGVAEVKATAGDDHLGGLDYDDAIAEFVRERLVTFFGEQELPAYVEASIRREAQRAKHLLSSDESAVLVVNDIEVRPGRVIDVPIHLDRTELGTITADLDARVLREVDRVFASAAVPHGAADYVLLTGQGTKMPSLRAAIERRVPAPVRDDYQDDAVVLGLPRQAGVLVGLVKDTLLLDTMVSGIGVRGWTDGDLRVVGPLVDAGTPDVHSLVWRDTTIPTKRSEIVRARPDPVGRVALHVVELPTWGATDDALPVGVVEVDVPDERDLELTIDVEANGVIVLEIGDPSAATTRQILLSGPRDDSMESIRDQRLTGSLEESQDLA